MDKRRHSFVVLISSPSSAEVKDEWSATSTRPYVFMA